MITYATISNIPLDRSYAHSSSFSIIFLILYLPEIIIIKKPTNSWMNCLLWNFDVNKEESRSVVRSTSLSRWRRNYECSLVCLFYVPKRKISISFLWRQCQCLYLREKRNIKTHQTSNKKKEKKNKKMESKEIMKKRMNGLAYEWCVGMRTI